MRWFRTHELFLGIFLTVAVFALGLTFSLTIFPQNQAAESDSRSDHPKEKTPKIGDTESADERIAKYTFWLAVLTGALVTVSAFQGYFLIRSDKTARISAEAARKSVETAQAEFIAAHRPQIRVRNIVVNQPQSADGRVFPLFSSGHAISGQLFVVNVGGSRADILDGHCTVFWTQQGQLPMRRPYEGRDDNLHIASRTLLSGQSTFGPFRSDNVLPAEIVCIAGNEIGSWNLYVMGWIRYMDRNNDERRTSFCREFRRIGGSEGRFYKVDDPDYEREE
jgi:hypothetical protein